MKSLTSTRQVADGYTLIEILVSIALLSILSGIGVTIYSITSASYQRSDNINKMQAQGSQAIEQLERSIRSANGITAFITSFPDSSTPSWVDASACPGVACSLIVLSEPSGSLDADNSAAANSVNGNAPCQSTAYLYQPNTATKNGRLQRIYGDCGATPSLPAQDLFETDPLQGYSVEGYTLTQHPAVGSAPPSVTIAFTVMEGVNVKPGGSLANRAKVPLQTTTSLRNY